MAISSRMRQPGVPQAQDPEQPQLSGHPASHMNQPNDALVAPPPPNPGLMTSGPQIDAALHGQPVAPADPYAAAGMQPMPQAQMQPPPAPAPPQQPPTAPTGQSPLNQQISQLLNNPTGYNNNVVNARTEAARETMERQRLAEMDTIGAQLAERGLLGDGAEISALSRLSEDLSGQFAGTVRDINADAMAAGDQQMIELLSLSTGMSIEEAKRAVEMFQAQTNREIGQGNIGLGYANLNNNANQFGAQHSLNQQRFAWDQEQGGIENLIRLITLIGAN